MQEENRLVERIQMQSVYDYLLGLFNLERGLPFTLLQLALRPGKAIHDFLNTERRSLYMKPFPFVFLCSIIATAAIFWIADRQEILNNVQLDSQISFPMDIKVSEVTGFARKYSHLMQLAIIPVMAFLNSRIFRNKLNYAEHLVIASFLMGMVFVIQAISNTITLRLLADIQNPFLNGLTAGVGFLSYVLFVCYFLSSVFKEKSRWEGIAKSLGVYILSIMAHSLITLVIVGIKFLIFDKML